MADEEPVDEEPGVSGTPSAILPKGRRSFRHARRELTDEELPETGVTKMMLDEIDRLEGECFSLRELSDRFHDADKQVGILEEKLKQRTGFDILTGGALAIGSALTGFAPNMWSSNHLATIVVALAGFVLTAVGVVAKVKAK
jgi:hypothetical protein